MSVDAEKTPILTSPPAVAATTPPESGSIPAAPADAAGGRGNTRAFAFPVLLRATVTIDGEIEDEARNTVGCDLRAVLADGETADLDNGGVMRLDGFSIGSDLIGRVRDEAPAMLAALRFTSALIEHFQAYGVEHLDEGQQDELDAARAILARIGGEGCAAMATAPSERIARNLAALRAGAREIPALTTQAATVSAIDWFAGLTDDLLAALYQYRNDLRHPLAPDSRERRIEMVEKLLARVEP